MLPTKSVHFIPAGKAPQRGADAVKACYLKSRAWKMPGVPLIATASM
jgi:hypothetical protein